MKKICETFRLGFILLVIGVFPGIVPSADAGPIRSVSYSDFNRLVRRCVGDMPDLRKLWEWNAGNPTYGKIYFGGGGLRGLLRYLEERLAAGAAPDLLCRDGRLQVANFLQAGADRDLYVSETQYDLKAFINTHFASYGAWDVLDEVFANQSVQAGGAAIEKLKVSPTEVVDPYGALEDFYYGRLRFIDVPESQFAFFRSPHAGGLNSNSKTALVLRALRFSKDLPSASFSEQELSTMREWIVREYNANYLPANNYWITKALRKLMISINGDVAEAKRLLGKPAADALSGRSYVFSTQSPPAAQVQQNGQINIQVGIGQILVNGQPVAAQVQANGQPLVFQQGGVRIEIQVGCGQFVRKQ